MDNETATQATIVEALKIERELCAKMVENFYDVDFPGCADAIDVGRLVCRQLAEAIRNR